MPINIILGGCNANKVSFPFLGFGEKILLLDIFSLSRGGKVLSTSHETTPIAPYTVHLPW